MSRGAALSSFHPKVAAWFREQVGEPTEIQALAWPRIAAGEHLLVSAPTGSGKTLTAFLWALDQLLTGVWAGGRVRVLYVSPLRALNNDIRRNLLAPLADLERELAETGEPVQPVRVATRSGDTTSEERRRMLRHPPEILITTPESLNILLTSKGGRRILKDVTCVILDEIHAVAASKRGVHLMTAVERLTLLSGEFQRLALSATVSPAERIARFVGGWSIENPVEEGEALYRPRPVEIVASSDAKVYDLEVVYAGDTEAAHPLEGETKGGGWEPVVHGVRQRIKGNRSTLIFANSRRTTEKLTRFLNDGETGDLAYSHHGSLSREIRAVVEERLKAGRLQAIVATNSLELGIDIGALDEVVLVQTPPTVASAIQRLGRAGHAVGEVSRGRLFPLVERDLLDAAVVARSVLEQDIEEVRPVEGALDVLAQVVLSMLAAEPWDRDELLGFLRSTYPYRRLTERQFDLVLEMLAGRYARARIRELNPRIRIDRVEHRLEARPGAARLIYLSGGTIPDRGYFHLRVHDSMAKIGELDEEFVWERSVGDTFTLGAQAWRIRAVTHNDVLVTPARRSSAMAPFWRAEERNRSFHLSDRIGRFLEVADGHLTKTGGGEELTRSLVERHLFDAAAAAALVELLERQRAAVGGTLPHRHHLLIERVKEGESDDGRKQVVLHTFWGGRVLRPFALALAAAWEKEHGWPLELEHDNDCLALAIPADVDPGRLFELVRSDNVEELLRERLEGAGFFGARFRESAGRALLLPRKGFRRRVPLWLSRQRSKKLLAAVRSFEDFPILAETWRTCLEDEFELESLVEVLAEIERGEILWSEVDTDLASPFAGGVFWKRTNRLMYEDDRPEETGASKLSRDLLRELVHSSQLRPRLPADLLDSFQRKLHRTYPGYAPRTADELTDWVVERVAIPEDEWLDLMTAIGRDLGAEDASLDEILEVVARRVVRVELRVSEDASPARVICAIESISRLEKAVKKAVTGYSFPTSEMSILSPSFGGSISDEMQEDLARLRELESGDESELSAGDLLAELASEWLRYYGPISRDRLTRTFGLDESTAADLLETLVGQERVVIDHFRQGIGEGAVEEGELELCDAENLERLLRLLRAAFRPSFEAQELERLPLFLAERQGLLSRAGDPEALKEALEGLFGYVAPVGLWESDLLPARLEPYYTSWLDALFQESDLTWFGAGRERLGFALGGDLELFAGIGETTDTETDQLEEPGRFDELVRRTGLATGELASRLWDLAWKGRVSNTTFLAVRQAALARFEISKVDMPDSPEASRPSAARDARRRQRGGGRRRPFDRWRSSRPWPGEWYPLEDGLPGDTEPLDALEEEELKRDRVRILLRRYGVLFRELLLREVPELQWSRLFRTLRILELSGEVLAGRFFDDVPGLQFASPGALRRLREGLPEDAVYWLSAADPASPCGLGLDALRGALPPRVASSHLVYHGSRLVLVSKRHGGELDVRVGPDHPDLGRYYEFLKVLLTRQFQSRRVVSVEKINGEPAAKSPYLKTLSEMFALTREEPGVKLRRRY